MATYDITIAQGNDFVLNGVYKDEDGKFIDMSSMVISGAIYEDYDTDTPLAVFDSAITQPISGAFALSLSSSITQAFEGAKCVNGGQSTSHLGIYITDLYTTSGKRRFLEGKVKLNRRPKTRVC